MATTIATDTLDVFDDNTVGFTGLRAISTNGGPYSVVFSTLGAFDVLAATPEPETFGLVAVAMAIGLYARRRITDAPAYRPI